MAVNKMKIFWFSLFSGISKIQLKSLPVEGDGQITDVVCLDPFQEEKDKEKEVQDKIENILKRINGRCQIETVIYSHSIEYFGSYIKIKSTFTPKPNLTVRSPTENEVDNQNNYIHDYQFLFDGGELIEVSMLTSRPQFYKFRDLGLIVELNVLGYEVEDHARRTILEQLDTLSGILFSGILPPQPPPGYLPIEDNEQSGSSSFPNY
jgi:hypothetical protein